MWSIVSVGCEPGPEVNKDVRPRPLLMGTGGKTKQDQTRLHCGGSRVSDNETFATNGQSLHVFICMFGEGADVRVCKHAKQNI